MIPQRTPTYWFSALWHSRASSMAGRVQPPKDIQPTAKASSTDAEELSPAPRGTSEANTACMPATRCPCSESAHATPAGYAAQPGSGDPSSWAFVDSALTEKRAVWPKSSASTEMSSEPLDEKATYVARSMAAGRTKPPL